MINKNSILNHNTLENVSKALKLVDFFKVSQFNLSQNKNQDNTPIRKVSIESIENEDFSNLSEEDRKDTIVTVDDKPKDPRIKKKNL